MLFIELILLFCWKSKVLGPVNLSVKDRLLFRVTFVILVKLFLIFWVESIIRSPLIICFVHDCLFDFVNCKKIGLVYQINQLVSETSATLSFLEEFYDIV